MDWLDSEESLSLREVHDRLMSFVATLEGEWEVQFDWQKISFASSTEQKALQLSLGDLKAALDAVYMQRMRDIARRSNCDICGQHWDSNYCCCWTAMIGRDHDPVDFADLMLPPFEPKAGIPSMLELTENQQLAWPCLVIFLALKDMERRNGSGTTYANDLASYLEEALYDIVALPQSAEAASSRLSQTVRKRKREEICD